MQSLSSFPPPSTRNPAGGSLPSTQNPASGSPPSAGQPYLHPSPLVALPRTRELMLVDLDCFYVSVERARDPKLEGRPVIVGGLPHERGVVASASYEARRHGVHAGMPLFRAARLCPRGETVFLPGDHATYLQASRQVMEILGRFTPRVEPLSPDEALLDLGGCERQTYATNPSTGTPGQSWLHAAEAIQRTVKEETGLPISIGIGPSRPVARVACALAKPHGLLEVRPGEAGAFLSSLPLRYLPGLGPKLHKALSRFHLQTIGDLARLPERLLQETFGAVGMTLSQRARGFDAELDAAPIGRSRPKSRSLSRETSFARDTEDPDVVGGMLSYLAQRAATALREDGSRAKAVGIRLRYSDFQTVEMRRRLPPPGDRVDDILALVGQLWKRCWNRRVKIRLVGVTLHDLEYVNERQLELFDGSRTYTRDARSFNGRSQERLDSAVDLIRERHGFGAVTRGQANALLSKQAFKRQADKQTGFRLRTPACSR